MEQRFIEKEIDGIKENNLEKLKAIFPSVVRDGQVDFEELKKMLGNFETVKNEKYEFTWCDKQKAKQVALSGIKGKTLKLAEEDSKNLDTTENLYIEGDNLEALKLLKNNYAEKIKMIYIDPPYNTGKDFVYKDKFGMSNEEINEALGNTVNGDKQVNLNKDEYAKNSKEESRYHSKWLNMMYPRLYLAQELLRNDGIMFISIDNNEQSNLKKMCDEIFGESNFIANIGLEITKTQGMKVKSAKEGSIVKNYEYILCYSKNNATKKIVKQLLYDKNTSYDTHFSIYLEDKNWVRTGLVEFFKTEETIANIFQKFNLNISMRNIETMLNISKEFRELLYNKYSSNIYQEMACNISIPDEISEELDTKDIVKFKEYILTKTSGGKIRQLGSLKETLNMTDGYEREYTRVTIRGDLWKGFYSDMMNVAKEGDIQYANGKKPIRLIKQLMQWIGVGNNDYVLDFFSGSGTTAHSCMKLNSEDSLNRKYIMIQLPEDLEANLEKSSGDENTSVKETIKFLESIKKPLYLSEIGKERIRRAGEQIKLDLIKAGEAEKADKLDIGFKVLKVDETNINWERESYKKAINKQLMREGKELQEDEGIIGFKDIYSDFIDGTKDIDIVYELMLRYYGVTLEEKIDTLSDIGNRTYSVCNTLIVCLEDEITAEIIDKVSEIDCAKIYFRDSSFKGDNALELKENLMTRLELQRKNKNHATYRVEFI